MSTVKLPIGRDVRLSDRYELDSGDVLMTGTQATVRLLLDQMRADRAAGKNISALVSGYRGSPLGGLDQEIARRHKLCSELGIVHRPAINEELGATSAWGSQLVTNMPDPRVEGVLGVWYGKAPGVDRAADALRHGNFVGAHPRGGLLALCGDDPSCKSSTLPSASEQLLAALRMPVVYPGSPKEVIELGRHAVAASRVSGTWVALKIATAVADGVESVPLTGSMLAPVLPTLDYQGQPYVHAPTAQLFSPWSLESERTLAGPRLELARAYARLNDLNPIIGDREDGQLGIIAAGTTYYDVREALERLGAGKDAELDRIRVLKLGMIWPLDPEVVREFAKGLKTIVVLEEKGPFLETMVKDILFDAPERPRVFGAHDADGNPLSAGHGTLDLTQITRAIQQQGRALGLDHLDAAAVPELTLPMLPEAAMGPTRTPFFCSGCPHNRSTIVPDDAVVGGGIGCHGMARQRSLGKGQFQGLTQMGGEGAQWIGQAPFTGTEHIFQNLGDGTFHHSGSLSVRAAVAAKVNITFKLLYNRAVAMTGGQHVDGAMGVPALTHWLEMEGVRRVIVTTDENPTYGRRDLSRIADLRPRSELIEVQRELAKTPGVTVLIHDQGCAAELRRLRKRGEAPERTTRIAINQRVCEGCGDCGQKSQCLSVHPVETEFGRKTRIHQSSCNKDYSCVDGDCPSFLKVVPGTRAKREAPALPTGLPAPRSVLAGEVTLRLIGIGGTGVVTVAQVLEMAALLDGKSARGLDQTGLAQKGGPVVSDVRFVAHGAETSNHATSGSVDGYLAFDLIAATTDANLATAQPGRTVAVISTSLMPTAQMIGDPDASPVDVGRAVDRIAERTTRERNASFDAVRLSEILFQDSMAANAIVVGAAWQLGLIPVSIEALEEAFRLNGVAIDANIAAVHWGRAAVARPDTVSELVGPSAGQSEPSDLARRLVAELSPAAGSELERTLLVRVDELIGYQGARLARTYLAAVKEVMAAEHKLPDTADRLSASVAAQLHKLMAYKDEYEVARLHLDAAENQRLRAEFGEDAKFYFQLHPPLLRALGLKRKLSLGPWFTPFLKGLAAMRHFRGTPLDIFGYAKVRVVERELPEEYLASVRRALPYAGERYDAVLEICELPRVVRGYEEIKLRGVERFREQADALLAELTGVTTHGELAGASAEAER